MCVCLAFCKDLYYFRSEYVLFYWILGRSRVEVLARIRKREKTSPLFEFILKILRLVIFLALLAYFRVIKNLFDFEILKF